MNTTFKQTLDVNNLQLHHYLYLSLYPIAILRW